MQRFHDLDAAVRFILEQTGGRIRLAVPLGIGKPNPLVNALYRRARADPAIELHVYTALTLSRPTAHGELERRFLEPFAQRVWGDYPDLEYERDRVAGALPANVRVFEFYLYAGKYLKNPAAQRDYISTNYTYVARDLTTRDVNVVAQAISPGTLDGRPAFSLSSNPDVSPDLIRGLRAAGRPCLVVGQVNTQLPFMLGDAAVEEDLFDCIIDDPQHHHRLFATPKTPITDQEYALGLHASTLIRDGGTLQIGIGSLGDALVYALKLRHEHNDVYREVIETLGATERFGATIEGVGGLGPFDRGLFAATEMLVDGFMHLIDAGIVKRKVYDDIETQRAVDEGRVDDKTLHGGRIVHAGFFLGPERFYQWLRDLSPALRAQIAMRPVTRVNQLFGDEELFRLQRRHARFVNTTMMITMSGAAVSDGLQDGHVVSGVGGQYNFVAMGHALADARSILQVRSTRRVDGADVSNIVWSYGHTTIARHQRDIVVTEHGIADLRARTDEEIVQALLAVADTRCQDELADRARHEGKLAGAWTLPEHHRHNFPSTYAGVLDRFRARGLFPRFPFGTELTDHEQVLGRALSELREKLASRSGAVQMALAAATEGGDEPALRPYLERMGLHEPHTALEHTYRRLLTAELRKELGLDT